MERLLLPIPSPVRSCSDAAAERSLSALLTGLEVDTSMTDRIEWDDDCNDTIQRRPQSQVMKQRDNWLEWVEHRDAKRNQRLDRRSELHKSREY